MSARTSRRPLVAGLAGIAVALSGLAVVASTAPAQANPGGTGLVISEVYGGGGNTGAPYTNDFIELYNPTDAPISVAGWSVQGRSATNTSTATTGANITALTGSVPAGGYYLVQEAAGTTVTDKPLPAPDATGTMGIAGAGWQIWLANTTTPLDPVDGDVSVGTPDPAIIDLVGAATNSASFEKVTANEAPSNTLSAQRSSSNADTDHNANDFSTAAPTPTNSAVVGDELTVTQPDDVTAYVGDPIAPITLAATGGTEPYSWDVAGLPVGLTETSDGVIGGTPNVDGTFPITATVTDSADPLADDDATFTITVNPALVPIPIAEIQGDGAASPLVGDPVITQGVVTAAYPAGGFFGFYLQTEGTGGSVDPATRTTSDGIFVRQTAAAGDVTVARGDFVQVTGTVTEFAGQTQVEVTDAADIEAVAGTPDPVTPVTTTSWPDTDAEKEALEGMLYSPEGDFTVSNTFGTNTFGEVGLAVGTEPLIQPTEVADAQDGPAIDAVEADNAARAIVLDDGSTRNYTSSGNSGLTPPYISNSAPVRVGAAASFPDDINGRAARVILTEGGSTSAPTYRFQPLQTVVGPANAESPATFENTRTPAPDAAAIDPEGTADLKIASFNVLNYFTTLGDANDDNIGDGGCTAFNDRSGDGNSVNSGCDQRGAWDPQDLGRQQEKIVSTINALDADVVGLMEIENSATLGETADEATGTLVAALNADAGAGTWAANPSSTDLPPVADMDVITNAIIYKVASVDRVGEARALGNLSSGTDAFNNAREPIAQAFVADGDDSPFLVVVNHFKSKGSGVDDGTGQGNANPDRVAQAEALRDWVPTVETDLGVDATFLVGDFNAYTMEDPMQVFYAAGYTDVAPEDEYSYSFSGLSGSLDHVVADQEALAMVTGSDIWNINSGESVALEYSRWNSNATDFHLPGPYRSSDHDPVVVGIDFPDTVVDTTVSATGGPVTFGTSWNASVTVAPDTATGQVEVLNGNTSLGTADLSSGTASVPINGTALQPGTHTLTVEYAGDSTHAPSSSTFEVLVNKTATTVSATGGPVVFGTNWSAAATVAPPSATGTVEVALGNATLGSATLSSGSAAVTVSGTALAPGTHVLTVRYLGNATHAASTNTFTVIVNPPAPGATVTTVTVPPMNYGTPVTATIKVTSAGPVSGTVELREGGTLIGTDTVSSDGNATIAIPGTALSVGSHTLTAKYLGDAENEPSQGSAQVQVAKAVSTTTLDVDPSQAVVGQDRITLTAAVSAPGVTPTGQVVFSANGIEVGTAPVTGGTAMLTVGPAPGVGTVQITAAYQGDATTAPSASPSADLTVVKADVRLRAEVKPKPVIVDRTDTRLVIEVSAPGQKVTGKVKVTWQGKTRTVQLDNGKATVQLGTWGSTGEKQVKVRYLGSSLANPETKVVTFQVRPRR